MYLKYKRKFIFYFKPLQHTRIEDIYQILQLLKYKTYFQIFTQLRDIISNYINLCDLKSFIIFKQ